jgi:hypothetical protein
MAGAAAASDRMMIAAFRDFMIFPGDWLRLK